MSTWIDKRGRGLQQKYTFCTRFLCPIQQPAIFFFGLLMFWTPNTRINTARKKSLKQSLSFEGPSPLSVYLGRHWCHACDKCSQVFCLHFCILQTIKNWTVGRPRNEVNKILILGDSYGSTKQCSALVFETLFVHILSCFSGTKANYSN